MPTYTLIDTKTNEKWTETMTVEAYEELIADPTIKNVWLEMYGNPPSIGDPMTHGTITKPNDAFRDVLREVKKSHKNALSGGTNIDTF